MRAAETSAPLREWLGDCGSESYLDYFCKVKRDEWQDYHVQVSDWELRRYLTLF